MTDLEITKLCAEAMGISGHSTREGREMWTTEGWEKNKDALVTHCGRWQIWNPLHDDAQAMALVKKRGISVRRYPNEGMWLANLGDDGAGGWSPDLNRAVCEFVAQMQQAKEKSVV